TASERPVKLPQGILSNDLDALLNDKSISIGVELVGGTGIAKDIQLKMLKSGKDVVTANKALLAEHGNELFRTAHENGRCIAFEASCAGGIPIISAIRTGLSANNITAMYGIVNGTCNYILSKMTAESEEFDDVLKEAQQLGYAEADPTLDINGGDSAHKLVILASMAFGYEISIEDVFVEGIEGISKDDIRFGGEMDYILKLLAIAHREQNGKISLRVHPSFIAKDNPLALVNGPFNAISIFGSSVGRVMLYGQGAGMMPTASAVVADIIEVALGNSATTFRHQTPLQRDSVLPMIENIDNISSRFYIRCMAKDQPGVFAQIGKILAENQISISGVLQHEGRGQQNTIPLVITTHETQQSKVKVCLKGLAELETIINEPVCIRIVDIPEDKN
ncbi:MAG: homoserine dehydrogenase, partial [Planctomycetota bacterium]